MTYNDPIIIQQPTESRNDYGEVVPAWSTYKELWAEITDVQSNVTEDSDMMVFEDAKSFKIHKQDAPDVTSKMRIYYDSQVYRIRSIRKEGRLWIILVAEAYDDE